MKLLRIALAAMLLTTAPAVAGGLKFAPVMSSEISTAQAVIMAAGSRASAVKQLRKVPTVGVVNLNIRHTPLMSDSSLPDVREFRISAAKNAAGIRKLRAALSEIGPIVTIRDPVTRKALARHKVPVNRIVGVKISSSGALRVYVL